MAMKENFILTMNVPGDDGLMIPDDVNDVEYTNYSEAYIEAIRVGHKYYKKNKTNEGFIGIVENTAKSDKAESTIDFKTCAFLFGLFNLDKPKPAPVEEVEVVEEVAAPEAAPVVVEQPKPKKAKKGIIKVEDMPEEIAAVMEVAGPEVPPVVDEDPAIDPETEAAFEELRSASVAVLTEEEAIA